MAALRTVVVGLGRMGRRRVETLRNDPRFQIIHVIDAMKESAKAVGSELGCSYSTAMISQQGIPQFDVGIVCAPNSVHHEIAGEMLRRGAHVFCEKPLSTTAADARELADLAKDRGLKLQVGANARYFPSVVAARAAVDEGIIGTPFFARGWVGHDGSLVMSSKWALNPAIVGGGTLMDNGPHLIDLIRWFLGEVRRVSGVKATLHQALPASQEDNFAGILEMADGGLAVVHSSWTELNGYLYLEIHGPAGILRVDCTRAQDRLEVRRASGEESTLDFSSAAKDSFARELAAFRMSIDGQAPCRPDGVDGARVVEVIESLYTSAAEGRAIEI